jgi:hypothetical protein
VAIQPIDLQTLYTQLDKIGKTQVQQQVAAQAERDAEITANRNDADKRLKTVRETDAGDEITGKVHEQDAKKGRQEQPGSHERKDTKEDEAPGVHAESEKEVIKDPALGTHIDISG